MMSRTMRAAAFAVALLATLSCSKTADTAPERRVFGDPPTIQSVEFTFDPAAKVDCDFTALVLTIACDQAGGVNDFQFISGKGWNKRDGQITYADPPSAAPGIFIDGTYNKATFKVKVSDPQSVPGKSDILLVSSSFVQPPPSKSETSLVLFDDGSFNKFQNPQRLQALGEDCTVDPASNTCQCLSAKYDTSSGDETANDGYFTRAFPVVNNTDSGFLLDSIMKCKGENVAFPEPVGTQLTFKIEAVDREGNLATWPTKLTGTTGTDTFVCNGDPCGCCFLYAFSLQGVDQSECGGLDGMISPSSFPNGLCHFLNGT